MRKSGFRDWARHKKFLEYSFSNPGQTSGISVSYFFMLAGTAGLGNWRGSWQERMRDRHISRVVPGVIRVSLQGSFLSRARDHSCLVCCFVPGRDHVVRDHVV